MPKNHEKFHSTNGLRRILIVDDEMVNREILGALLQDEYELLFACDGAEALRVMRENKDTLSLVLLDILMPVMSGKEVLKAVREDDAISHIPVIVITSEQDAEAESLKLGAIDFLPKPYPAVDVVKARVLRTIELSEDRDIIRSTERDALTGLYNREYFYRYAEQYDQYHRETPMDAIVLDINHFHMVNERYGKPYGDQVLRRIGEKLREMLSDSGGIVCRRGGDTFMAYCPHREDYQEILYSATAGLAEEGQTNSRVRLRMGVYSYVDKSIDIERRFDRAKMASDTVRGSFTRTIGVYDGALHEKQLFAEQLIEDFPTALAENQFVVFYQPKFDVRPDTPILSGAEALVRWNHPTLGFISPGVFVPLFEENGLIQKLDHYVWRETARQIRSWRDSYGFAVPISVNVSRIDMFDPNLVDTLQSLLEEFELESQYLHLEVTESAYTQNSGQIVDAVERLRSIGFQIEMDDFGTGYSSLNMISSLPIDVLKLDMQFIRSAFREGGNTKMLEIVIDIADYLSVPVIAEGVETGEQLAALKQLGCDMVQGYFFSKPVPAVEFEPFILQKKGAEKAAEDAAREREAQREAEKAELRRVVEIDLPQETEAGPEAKADAVTEAETEREIAPDKPGLHLRTANVFFVVLAFLAAAALLIADLSVTRGYQRMAVASDRHIAAQLAASEMVSASDYLTDRVRCFVVTGEIEYLHDFFEEVETTRRRDQAVADLEALLDGRDSGALAALNTALELSNELVQTEYRAMRLTLEPGDYPMEDIPEEIAAIRLTPAEQSMSREELLKTAQDLVFDNNYMHAKDRIRENVNLCTQAL
ncbi:MAG: EAL domain-containing protein, partial [Oscillospiraceae bacterium]|nr:EAL domain-containing protein [Oscillospiraceae bacterium]